MKSKTVFLIDAVGAALTAILLIALVKNFNSYFGIPIAIIDVLSIFALIISIYSFCCFAFAKNNISILLKIIIVANSCYCISTFVLVIYFYNNLTILGVVYFISEIFILCALIYLELKIVKDKKKFTRC